jgi:dihydrofolate reductase
MARISIIAAIGKNRELGKGGELVWRIPDDLRRFKSLTTGHPIIMGRKTFDSIGRALPERTNIVVTRDEAWQKGGAFKASSIEQALELAKQSAGSDEIFIIGGGEIYKQSLPFADRLCLTLIDASKDADAFFPEYENIFNKKTFEEKREFNGLKYSWINLEK